VPASDADRSLLEVARRYQGRAHAPLSNYRVGAALRGADGRVFGGCNVEHIVMSLSCCAERVAVFTGIAEGSSRFTDVAVFTDSSPPAAPCGSCRQALHGFGVERVVMGNPRGEISVCTLRELLPRAFDLEGPVAPSSDT
jgi:cytidine deaminase